MRSRRIGPTLALILLAALLPTSTAQAAPSCFGRTATIVGTRGNDRLVGTPGNDVIFGGRGTDLIEGRGGNDRLCAGSGEDTLRGGGGRDRLDSGGGDESGRGSNMFGGLGDDLLQGNDFAGEEMHGGDGNDTLHALGTNRTYEDGLDGGPGDDELIQEEGPSFLQPGPGNDRVSGAGAPAAEEAFSRSDNVDYLDLRSAPGPLVVDLAAGTATGEGDDQVAGVEVLIGGPFDDTLSGGGEESIDGEARPIGETLYGMGGNDVLVGGEGDNCLVGDPVDSFGSCGFAEPDTAEGGNDELRGGAGNDFLRGGLGDDRYMGELGEDMVTFLGATTAVTVDLGTGQATGQGTDSIEGVENVRGSQFDDTLIGDDGANLLVGEDGNDVVRGAGGDDTLHVTINDASDLLDGGAGSDTASYQCFMRGQTIDVDLEAGTDSVGDQLVQIENVTNFCYGTTSGDDGPNRLRGATQLFGRGGDDVLEGGSTDDLLNGGPGTDTLDGRTGTDTCTEGESVVNCEGP